MEKITILTSYFGKFNNYFDLWLNSVNFNPTIEFKLLTDNRINNIPANMTVVNMSFTDMQHKVSSYFDFPIVIDTGYKMSEYQPLFAEIFPELVVGADFWGYCEMDMILGDLRKFFSAEKLASYDKIYYLGHLTLYRNIKDINRIALVEHKYPVATYKQAFSTSYNYHFIEEAMRYITNYSGMRCYEKIEFADVSYKFNNFTLAHGHDCSEPQIFKWTRGVASRIYLKNHKIYEEEFSYIHLQKRKMEVETNIDKNDYMIVPNKFINSQKITEDFLKENSKDTKEWRKWYRNFYRNYYLKTLMQGGIKIKFDKIIRRLLYSKNINVDNL